MLAVAALDRKLIMEALLRLAGKAAVALVELVQVTSRRLVVTLRILAAGEDLPRAMRTAVPVIRAWLSCAMSSRQAS